MADAVRETLEERGWAVESCADGAEALRLLGSTTDFDLLVFDNDLPGLGGLELIRQARRLPNRCRLPIIMLSASDVEAQARRAGADAFLRKPNDIGRLAHTIARFLSEDNP